MLVRLKLSGLMAHEPLDNSSGNNGAHGEADR